MSRLLKMLQLHFRVYDGMPVLYMRAVPGSSPASVELTLYSLETGITSLITERVKITWEEYKLLPKAKFDFGGWVP